MGKSFFSAISFIFAAILWFFRESAKEIIFSRFSMLAAPDMSIDHWTIEYGVTYGPPILFFILGVMALSGIGQNIHVIASLPFLTREINNKATSGQVTTFPSIWSRLFQRISWDFNDHNIALNSQRQSIGTSEDMMLYGDVEYRVQCFQLRGRNNTKKPN